MGLSNLCCAQSHLRSTQNKPHSGHRAAFGVEKIDSRLGRRAASEAKISVRREKTPKRGCRTCCLCAVPSEGLHNLNLTRGHQAASGTQKSTRVRDIELHLGQKNEDYREQETSYLPSLVYLSLVHRPIRGPYQPSRSIQQAQRANPSKFWRVQTTDGVWTSE